MRLYLRERQNRTWREASKTRGRHRSSLSTAARSAGSWHGPLYRAGIPCPFSFSLASSSSHNFHVWFCRSLFYHKSVPSGGKLISTNPEEIIIYIYRERERDQSLGACKRIDSIILNPATFLFLSPGGMWALKILQTVEEEQWRELKSMTVREGQNKLVLSGGQWWGNRHQSEGRRRLGKTRHSKVSSFSFLSTCLFFPPKLMNMIHINSYEYTRSSHVISPRITKIFWIFKKIISPQLFQELAEKI